MIPAILLKGIEPAAATKALGGGRDYALRLLPQLDPGELVSARVDSKLPDGSYKVMVAGQALSMKLPSYVVPGDTLELAFVAREPRLTFALADSARAGTPLAQLSDAGRLVAATMLAPGETAAPLAAASPLLGGAPTEGARLADALNQALETSGLFYEAHQAEWVAGQRDVAQLRQEPQARLTQSPRVAEPGAALAALSAAETAPKDLAARAMDPRTVPLVQQQLAALDNAKVMLQLEVWPQQWMRWEIEEQSGGARREADAPPSWSTLLRLELPQLGELRAALTLSGSELRIRLDAASAASAERLRAHRGSLQAALTGAGVAPAGIAITHYEKA